MKRIISTLSIFMLVALPVVPNPAYAAQGNGNGKALGLQKNITTEEILIEEETLPVVEEFDHVMPDEPVVIEEVLPVEEATEEVVVEGQAVEESVSLEPDESSPVVSNDPVTTPTLSTDKDDYLPGEVATIYGSFFNPLQGVVLRVFGNSEVGDYYTDTSYKLTTDDVGYFEFDYQLDNFYRPLYTVIVSDLEGNELAQTTFLDAAGASVDVFDQCANDDGDGYNGDPGDCSWTNGNMNTNNSTIFEEDSTVQRLLMSGLTNGTHTVTLEYQTTKGGKHAYDFLTSFDQSEDWVTLEDLCSGTVTTGFASCMTAASSTSPDLVEDPLNTDGTDDTNQNIMIINGTISSTTQPVLVSGSYGADSLTNIDVEFEIDTSDCKDSVTKQSVTTCPVFMAWGAHVSSQEDWGSGQSAVNISGSPYHMKVIALDGASTGNRDNQMQAGAIAAPTQATLTLLKTVINDNGGTALDTAWTLEASGPTPITGVEGDTSITAALVDAGDYTLSESNGPSGYTASAYSCIVNGGDPVVSNSLILAPDDVAVCTITNDDIAPILHLRKVVVNDSGGSATLANFTLTANGTNSNDISGTSPVDSDGTLIADTFALSESNVGGYIASDWVCVGGNQSGSNITLGINEEATCTITNDDIAPMLTLEKTVVNDDGGEATEADFQARIDAGNVNWDAANEVSVGAHTASEIMNVSGYSASVWGGDCAADGSVTLAVGENKTCTITNNDIAPTLKLVKEVDNGDGGSATSDSWTLSADADVPDDGRNFDNLGGSGVFETVYAGAGYALSESDVPGYSAGDWSCDGGSLVDGVVTLGLDADVTCTITNNDIAPTLTLVKTVNNNYGGTAVAGDFQAYIDATPVGWDSAEELSAGSYVASEDGFSGYVAGDWGGDCDAGGNVTLTLGENKTCTITNNDTPGEIHGHKFEDTNGNGAWDDGEPALEGWTINLGGDASDSDVTDVNGEYSFTGLSAGNYTVTETLQVGWVQTTPDPSEIVLGLGEVVEDVDFGNFELGSVHGVKFEDIDGDGAAQEDGEPELSGWTIRLYEASNNPWALADSTVTDGNGEYSFDALSPGSYKACEVLEDGWTQTFPNIGDNNSSPSSSEEGPKCQTVNINTSGESNTRNFGNFELATLIVEKQTIPDADQTDFTFTGDVSGDISDGEQLTLNNVGPGEYTSTETVPDGWVLSDISCDNVRASGDIGTETATFNPLSGDVLTCVFTNNNPDAQIDLDPLTATNASGDDHVVTATVQVHGGDGNWGQAPDNTLVTFSLLNNNAGASFDGGNTCLTSGSSCPITINTTLTGGVDIHAEASPEVLGLAIDVATGSGGENSVDAHKDYVNARILIVEDDTNEVGDPHTFTVTVESDSGSDYVGVSGVYPVVTFSPSDPSSVTDNCNLTGTDGSGECTVEVNSTSAGIFEASASVSVNVSGIDFNLSTNGVGENSDTATKTYVDASIELTPQTGTNDVNDEHEITALVTKDDGTGAAPAQGETVTFTISSGTAEFVGGDNDCVTDVNGECSIFIVDDEPGDNEVDASVTVGVGGLNLDRATDGDYGPDGSNGAEKTYIAGIIIVQKITVGGDDNFNFNPSWTNDFELSNGGEHNSGYIATGAHSVSEDVLPGWELTSAVCDDDDSSDPASLTLDANETITCVFTNTKLATVTIVKDAQPNDAQDFNFGGDLGDFTLDDDEGVQDAPDPGQYDNSETFENVSPNQDYVITEVLPAYWAFQGASCMYTGTENPFVATPTENGLVINPAPGDDITCTFVNYKPTPTRTQGFWQTHTEFTSEIYDLYFAAEGGMVIGDGITHVDGSGTDGRITNKKSSGSSELFGAFFANIAKTTIGKGKTAQRDPVDKARMQLLQQLVAAKLNCAAFDCNQDVQDLIDAADAAYAGEDAGLILYYAGEMDAYNNSGDTIIIGYTFSHATPKVSRDYADLDFWNQP